MAKVELYCTTMAELRQLYAGKRALLHSFTLLFLMKLVCLDSFQTVSVDARKYVHDKI